MSTESEQFDFKTGLFRTLEESLSALESTHGAAETHGACCAFICSGVSTATLPQNQSFFDADSTQHQDLIEGIFALAERDLADDQFGFSMLLPNDESPLEDRIEALRLWCQGFIEGMVFQHRESPLEISEDVQEAIKDIHLISEVESSPDSEQDNEKEYQEVVEFVRVATQIVYESMGAPDNMLKQATANTH